MPRRFEYTAKYFRDKRIEAGKTQSELAEQLGFSSAQIVSNWERGICAPPMASLKTLIKILKLDPEEVTDVITEENRRFLVETLTGRKSQKVRKLG